MEFIDGQVRRTELRLSLEESYGTGKRKRAVARVFLRPGEGKITVNSRALDEYFPNARLRKLALAPLVDTKTLGKFDVHATICSGGITGQSGALRHGIARALLRHDESLRPILKEQGYLTRDARVKERKKYGQRGARARFQFSKR